MCNIGDVFGRLTVLDRDIDYENKRVADGRGRRKYYKCICECGKIVSILGSNLNKGATKSCGCLKGSGINHKIEDLSGKTFSNLYVLRRDVNAASGGGRHINWICECLLCGNKKSIRSSDLRSGLVTDCGCLYIKRASDCNTDDLTGKIFGHLRVKCRDTSTGYKCGQHARWICECDICSGTESVQGTYLKSGMKDRCRYCCKKSFGESKIIDILKENNIDFVYDKSYLDCKNDKTGYSLRFDFRITDPASGCKYIVEYDGQQHFKKAPNWDDTECLEERQRKDKLKNEWCKANGVPIIRIPYTKLRSLNINDLLLSSTQYLCK